MITLIEALNYRCLRYVSRPLKPFHVLVGPNASGKTTFLDVVSFLQDLVSEGLEAALENRTNNPQDLLFRREGDRFELAIEASIPDALRKLTEKPELGTVRYEVAIGFDGTHRQFEIKAEKLLLKETNEAKSDVHWLFPEHLSPPNTLVTPKGKRNIKGVINKVAGGNDNMASRVRAGSLRFVWGPRNQRLETSLRLKQIFQLPCGSGEFFAAVYSAWFSTASESDSPARPQG